MPRWQETALTFGKYSLSEIGIKDVKGSSAKGLVEIKTQFHANPLWVI